MAKVQSIKTLAILYFAYRIVYWQGVIRETPANQYFAGGLFLRESRDRVIVLLTAYFDETGTHDRAKLVGMSGFVARDDLWGEFEKQWLARLSVDKLDYFHAVDCQNRNPPTYQDLVYWTEGRRDLLFADLGKLVGSFGPVGISSAVKRQDWDEVYAVAPNTFKKRFPHPYHFCFEHCMQQVTAWKVAEAASADLALIFAYHDEHGEWASRIGKAYEKSQFRHGVVSVAFRSPQKIVALQSADLLAYEVGRAALEGRGESRPAIWNMVNRQSALHGGFFGKDELLDFIKKEYS